MKVSAPPVTTVPTPSVQSAAPVEPATGNGQAKGKDKDKNKAEPVAAASPPPQTPPLSPGLSMTAVYESQSGRRAEEKEAREAERERTRTAPPPSSIATDGSSEALRLMQDSVRQAAANEAAAAKAAEERRAEAERREAAPTTERSDPFSRDASETTAEAKPSIGFQAYQSSYAPPPENGSTLDARF